MTVMTGGDAIAESLIANGVDTVFGIPGIQLDNLFDAFYRRRNRLRVIHTRHEAGAAYMAMGYAQSTDRTGTFVVVPGPGLLNSLTALGDAASANLPVLGITGQIPSAQIGLGLGIPHEIKDQMRAAEGVVDWVRRANHPSEVPALVNDAFRHMRSRRRKPAVFEMAPDMMGAKAPVEILPAASPDAPPAPDPEAVRRAAAMIADATFPIVMVGGGIAGAEGALKALAERIGAPVVMNQNARGALPEDHPLAHHMLAGQELWAKADLVIAVGTRFTTPALSWGRGDLSVIRIDIDPVQIRKPARAALALVADAAEAMAALVQALEGKPLKARPDGHAAIREELRRKLDAMEPTAGYARALRQALPRDGMVFSDITQFGIYTRYGMPMYCPKTYLMPGYEATLGWAYPAALGAQIANPDRKVVTFAGDGGFLFNMQEMATAVQHHIPVVGIVFNNNLYGNVHGIQAKSFGGRHIAVDLKNPDFVTLARAFGMQGARVESADQMFETLRKFLDAGAPALIEVPVGDLPDMWSLVKRPPSAGPAPG
ncbi:MAG: thiamine pyrophosphate-binding protein [Alphaproteobacteria bacterium]|nr:thiamine pyrophosphate-binding protein [Alphaproteobacteria bacterium]